MRSGFGIFKFEFPLGYSDKTVVYGNLGKEIKIFIGH